MEDTEKKDEERGQDEKDVASEGRRNIRRQYIGQSVGRYINASDVLLAVADLRFLRLVLPLSWDGRAGALLVSPLSVSSSPMYFALPMCHR